MSNVVVHTGCSICGHRSRGHKFDSMGKTRCPECPQEICQRRGEIEVQSEFPNMLDFGELTTMGIKPIGEMTERELIEEIMHAQYVALTSDKFPLEAKRRMIAQIRISTAKARIYREAGVSDPWGGMFGWD